MPPKLVIQWLENNENAFPLKEAVKLKNQIISVSETEKSPHLSNYYDIIIFKKTEKKRHLIHGNMSYYYVSPEETTRKAG